MPEELELWQFDIYELKFKTATFRFMALLHFIFLFISLYRDIRNGGCLQFVLSF